MFIVFNEIVLFLVFFCLEPRADITATLILDLLEVTGNELALCYRFQFKKLLSLLRDVFFPIIEKVNLNFVSYKIF